MASIFALGGQTAWSQYTKVLEDFVGATDPEIKVQALSVSSPVEWDSPHENYNRFLQCDLANSLGQWSAVGNFTGRHVSEGYLEFLSTIQSTVSTALTPAEQALLDTASRKVKQLRGDAANLEDEIATRWFTYKRDMDAGRVPPLTRRQFEQQRGYEAQRSQIKMQIDIAQADYDSVVNRAGGDVRVVGNALTQYYAAQNEIALPESADDDVPELKDYWPLFKKQTIIGDVAQFKTQTFRQTIAMAAGRTESSSFSSSWGGSFGISTPFFGISGGASGSSYDERSSSETTDVSITVENMAEFRVYRSQWYQPTLFDIYGSRARGAWNQGGYLNVIPISFILARGLTVTASTSSEVKTYSKQTFDGGGGVRIGPFSFGGGGGSTSIHATCDTTASGLKITDISGRALVIGVKAVRPFTRTVNPLNLRAALPQYAELLA